MSGRPGPRQDDGFPPGDPRTRGGKDMLKQLRLTGKKIADFFMDESGMGTVEVILIIVVLIGLVIIFRDQIGQVVSDIFDAINGSVGELIGE